MRQILYSIIIAAIIILSFFSNWYGPLIIALISLLLIKMLYKIGNGIVLPEVTAILYVFTCLFMPLIGYEYYSSDNRLSRVWIKYMPVKPEVYFSFALPAVACFCFALTLPAFRKTLSDEGEQLHQTINRIKTFLNTRSNKGLQIMLVGVIVSLLAQFLPVSLNYFATLFYFSSFAGLLYIYFSSEFKYKKLVILLFILFILANALQSGMFTIVAYMGVTMFSFFQLGKKSSMVKKTVFFILTIAFFIVLQNVKLIYRKTTWKNDFQGNRLELFTNLFIDNAQKGSALLGEDALFPLYSRTNQGFNVALVMRRVPAVQPFDNGDRLMTVFASAFVPRFLWPDKPEAGGAFNMKYYAGWTIKGWSTNVGPLGEAFGSFGVQGGIIYMLLLGFFLRWVYLRVFMLAAKLPLIICWLPVLFYLSTSSAETDSLQILNSIFKSAFFLWLISKVVPAWFGIIKKPAIQQSLIKNVPA